MTLSDRSGMESLEKLCMFLDRLRKPFMSILKSDLWVDSEVEDGSQLMSVRLFHSVVLKVCGFL